MCMHVRACVHVCACVCGCVCVGCHWAGVAVCVTLGSKEWEWRGEEGRVKPQSFACSVTSSRSVLRGVGRLLFELHESYAHPKQSMCAHAQTPAIRQSSRSYTHRQAGTPGSHRRGQWEQEAEWEGKWGEGPCDGQETPTRPP